MWTCYVIGRKNTDHTYCGMTNNFQRRLRQHNCEISGGARVTTSRGPGWIPLFTVEGFETNVDALRAEWRLKHPGGHRRSRPKHGPNGRAEGLRKILEKPDSLWTSRCPEKICSQKLTIKIFDERVPSILTPDLQARYPNLSEQYA